MRILATVAISFLAVACSATESGVLPSDSMTLNTGGAPFEAQFTVKLSASGLLNVRRYGPPNVTPRTIELRLSAIQTADLLSIASNSSDFSKGCGQVADGTSASMTVKYSGVERTFSCSGAPKWPVGSNTSTLLSTINKHLPKELQVF